MQRAYTENIQVEPQETASQAVWQKTLISRSSSSRLALSLSFIHIHPSHPTEHCSNPLKEERISTPALAFQLVESEYDWQYPITFWDRDGEKRHEPKNTRGKVLGGSSCLNYYTWLRGSRPTYDEWVKYGGSEWSWDKCFPYFQKVRRGILLSSQ